MSTIFWNVINLLYRHHRVYVIINGYNLMKADDPNYVKEGGICLYCKESLKLRHVSAPDFSRFLL